MNTLWKKKLMKSRHNGEVQHPSLDKLKITRTNSRILQQDLLIHYPWHFRFALLKSKSLGCLRFLVLFFEKELLENTPCSNRDLKGFWTSEVHCINVRDLVNSAEIWDLRVVTPSVRQWLCDYRQVTYPPLCLSSSHLPGHCQISMIF